MRDAVQIRRVLRGFLVFVCAAFLLVLYPALFVAGICLADSAHRDGVVRLTRVQRSVNGFIVRNGRRPSPDEFGELMRTVDNPPMLDRIEPRWARFEYGLFGSSSIVLAFDQRGSWWSMDPPDSATSQPSTRDTTE